MFIQLFFPKNILILSFLYNFTQLKPVKNEWFFSDWFTNLFCVVKIFLFYWWFLIVKWKFLNWLLKYLNNCFIIILVKPKCDKELPIKCSQSLLILQQIKLQSIKNPKLERLLMMIFNFFMFCCVNC